MKRLFGNRSPAEFLIVAVRKEEHRATVSAFSGKFALHVSVCLLFTLQRAHSVRFTLNQYAVYADERVLFNQSNKLPSLSEDK